MSIALDVPALLGWYLQSGIGLGHWSSAWERDDDVGERLSALICDLEDMGSRPSSSLSSFVPLDMFRHLLGLVSLVLLLLAQKSISGLTHWSELSNCESRHDNAHYSFIALLFIKTNEGLKLGVSGRSQACESNRGRRFGFCWPEGRS